MRLELIKDDTFVLVIHGSGRYGVICVKDPEELDWVSVMQDENLKKYVYDNILEATQVLNKLVSRDNIVRDSRIYSL